MKIVVLAFARIREIVGASKLERELADGASCGALWRGLADEFPSLAELERSTRFARRGAMIDAATTLHAGDEIALLPPFGGG